MNEYPAGPEKEFDTLLRRVMDGLASPGELPASRALLRGNKKYIAEYVELLQLIASARICSKALLKNLPVVHARPSRTWFFAAVASLAILLGGTILFQQQKNMAKVILSAVSTDKTVAAEQKEHDKKMVSPLLAESKGESTDSARPAATVETIAQETKKQALSQQQAAQEPRTRIGGEEMNARKMAGAGTAAVAALSITATNLAAVLTAQGVDYIWLASPLSAEWNTTDANWNLGTWTNGAGNTATFGASSTRAITVADGIELSALNVADGAYTFTGGSLSLNGALDVAGGASATVDSAIVQTGTSSSARFAKTGAGALTLTGGSTSNLFYQMKQTAGTLIFNGGTHVIAKTGSGTADSDAALSRAGGTMNVTGGAEVRFGAGTALNSDGILNIENATLGADNLTFLNGVSSSTGKSVINIRDGGTLIAQTLQASGSTAASGTNNFCVNVSTGGVLQVSDFSSLDNDYGTVMFDGGTLADRSLNITSTAENKTRFKVGRGGMKLHLGYAKQFNAPIESGAERDGGLHVEYPYGGNLLSVRGNNTYNGGIWLDGADQMLAIWSDANLGAVPQDPTNNIFFTKTASLFADGNVTLNPNRSILINSNATAKFSSNINKQLVIRGTISGDNPDAPTNGAVETFSGKWWGSTPVVLGPGEGRTNQIGRLLVHDRDLILANGTTIVDGSFTSVEGGNTPFDVKGATFFVTGGVFRIKNGPYVANRGNVTVSGGLADFSSQQYLNAFRVPGTTTVCNAGILDCFFFRPAGAWSHSLGMENACLNVCTGGVLRLNLLADFDSAGMGLINFDGGMLVAKMNSENFLGNGFEYWRTNIFMFVREGGLVVSNAYAVSVKNPLLSGASPDGGLTKWGSGTLTLAYTNSFNGPVTIRQGTLAISISDALLASATVNVYSNAVLALGGNTQTVARLEGGGTITGCANLTVTGAIAPGEGANEVGTLTLAAACAGLEGAALEIDLKNDGTCDCLASSMPLPLSQLSLNLNDQKQLNKARVYTIVKAPQGFTGEFKATNVNKSWALRYNRKSNTVELAYRRGTVVMLI